MFREMLRSKIAYDTIPMVSKRGYKPCCYVTPIRIPPPCSQGRIGATRNLSRLQLDQHLRKEQTLLVQEAGKLSRSLYRTCVRSVRLIRHGNEHDEKEFEAMEERRIEGFSGKSPRMGMLSMLPPVDREDELRSRAEYYLQYLRENFVQESDSLDFSVLGEQHWRRFLHHLRRGNEHRRWLLQDMKFEDKYEDSWSEDRITDFQARTMDYTRRVREMRNSTQPKHVLDKDAHADEDDDGFWSDDEEEPSGHPEWYRNPRNT